MALVALAPFYSIGPFVTVGAIVFWFVSHTILNIKAIATILLFKTPRGLSARDVEINNLRSHNVDESVRAVPGSTRNVTSWGDDE